MLKFGAKRPRTTIDIDFYGFQLHIKLIFLSFLKSLSQTKVENCIVVLMDSFKFIWKTDSQCDFGQNSRNQMKYVIKYFRLRSFIWLFRVSKIGESSKCSRGKLYSAAELLHLQPFSLFNLPSKSKLPCCRPSKREKDSNTWHMNFSSLRRISLIENQRERN